MEESPPLRDRGIDLLQLSLRSLVYPVPREPQRTLRKRVVDSARGERWTDIKDGEEVPLASGWCDPQNVHVYLHVDLDSGMRAAERLYDKLWGKDLSVILEEISDNGNTWKYVPKKHIDSLDMANLGFPDEHGLLVRPEYDVAWEDFDYDAARTKGQGGIVVTGQPGIGKTYFLYYLLFRLLSEGTPVSLQLAPHILVFRDDGVYRHPQDAEPDYLPTGTWALSDAGRLDEKPCNTFLKAAGRHTAWIIQTAPPLEERWRQWKKQYTAVTFVMNGFSAAEITALAKVQGLDASALLRNHEKWGPSARTCVQLARDPAKGHHHAIIVNNAADAFVERPPPRTTFDAIEVFHVLFSVRPEVEEDRGGRTVPVAVIATEHIKRIISCAAAGAVARKRIEFYRIISTQPSFKVSAGKMFEGFVLSWLYTNSNVDPLRCFATGQLDLEIPACGEEQTTFFDSKNGLEKVNRDKLPLCLLPTSEDFPTAKAIVITDEFVITIQVITSDRHSAKGSDLADIKKLIPPGLGRDKWCHVFITDNDSRAISLRNQTLPELPKDILVYSGVFNIGWSGVTRKHMESFDEKKKIAELEPMCPKAPEPQRFESLLELLQLLHRMLLVVVAYALSFDIFDKRRLDATRKTLKQPRIASVTPTLHYRLYPLYRFSHSFFHACKRTIEERLA
ncbi:hypothetical protein EDB84DRAFT_1577925 [Lactarius hengduanensis]|nr:hypothetical protein EDB84DRAFT_1577925 [Lactarius hengduanensis]